MATLVASVARGLVVLAADVQQCDACIRRAQGVGRGAFREMETWSVERVGQSTVVWSDEIRGTCTPDRVRRMVRGWTLSIRVLASS